MIVIKKGINLPIAGFVKNNKIIDFKAIDAPVAVLGEDYINLRPSMKVAVGDSVRKGDPLFVDKKIQGLQVCAPVSGEIIAINRGERRRLISVVIKPNQQEARKFDPVDFGSLTREKLINLLVDVGFWSFFRRRPFDKTPDITEQPNSIFINTMDSNPLSFDPLLCLSGRENHFIAGVRAMTLLTQNMVHVCHQSGKQLPDCNFERVKVHAFSGKHPAGLVGTHIHFIDPVGEQKKVWHLTLQDLLAIGQLLSEGTLDYQKVIAVAGPCVENPQLVRVNRGVSLSSLLQGKINASNCRVISGSVFAGRKVNNDADDFLGAFDQQISVLSEQNSPIFLEFLRLGLKSFSASRAYLGRFLTKKSLPFTASLQGSPRPIVPFGIYETVMPLDILPTLLLKSLIVKDTENAIKLGALELVEEDVALLTYVDPGKHDFGAILRENLSLIEEEG